MSDFKTLESKMDARFDRLETKLDKYGERTTEHAEQIKTLQGYAKYGLTIFLAVCGFFAAAYFKY
jgi:hypothetical protein